MHPDVTLEFTGKVLSGTICAAVGLRVTQLPSVMVQASQKFHGFNS
jgi:hypothetical protein